MNKKKLIKYKRWLDRGGIYQGYYSIIAISLILINSFNIKEWWAYVVFILIVFILRFIAGWIDDKFILKEEQKAYSDRNPVLMEINDKIDKINDKLCGGK
jgi:hypothetical protein